MNTYKRSDYSCLRFAIRSRILSESQTTLFRNIRQNNQDQSSENEAKSYASSEINNNENENNNNQNLNQSNELIHPSNYKPYVYMPQFTLMQWNFNQLCMTDWPPDPHLQFNYIIDELVIDWNSLDIKLKCLKYWEIQANIDQWLDNDKYTESIPNVLIQKANQQIFNEIEQMNASDQIQVAHFFCEYIRTDAELITLMDKSTHIKMIKWAINKDESLKQYANDWKRKIDSWCDEEWLIADAIDTRYIAETYTHAVVEPDNAYYPTGSAYWMTMYLQWIKGDCTTKHINDQIKMWNDPNIPEVGNNDFWRPKHAMHLYWIHQLCAKIHNITQIKVTIPQQRNISNKINVKYENVTFGYDSIINDIQSWYKTTKHRVALMSNLSEWYKLKKQNPIHCRETNQERKNNKIHICQTRISQHFLFHFLEKICFIADHECVGIERRKTLMLKPGIFIWNQQSKMYGLIVDIISEQWSFNLHRNSNDETFFDWNERLKKKMKQWVHYVQHKENDNEIKLNPKYEITLLPLTYKFANCNDLHSHNHILNKELDLSLKIPSDFNNNFDNLWDRNYEFQLNILFRKVIVSDKICIGNIKIGTFITLKNPNKKTNSNLSNKHCWKWKYCIHNENVYSPMYFWEIYKLMVIWHDPFKSIMPGRGSPSDNITCCALQTCSDGLRVFCNDSSLSGYTSIKENYIKPIHHLLTDSLISSYGIVYEHGNNAPFYKLFMTDILRLFFRGIEIALDEARTIHVFGLLMSILNDGSEIKKVSGIAGPMNDLIDYLTTMRNHDTLLDTLIQALRHFRVLLTQKVLYNCICLYIYNNNTN